MHRLTINEVMNLKPGDDVYYKEKQGELCPYLFKAVVLEHYPHFVRLMVAADKNPYHSYDEANGYFSTCFAYTDAVEKSGYALYKEQEDPYDRFESLYEYCY